MANDYMYGTSAVLGDDIVKASQTLARCCVAVGVAPINLVQGYATKNLVNKPIKLTASNAKSTIGYSSNWGKFSLCECVGAFFNNPKGNVSPLFVINVLDPAVHKKENKTTGSLSFTNGVGTIVSDDIVLDTLTLTDMALHTDYEVSYDFNTKTVTVDTNGKAIVRTESVPIQYDEIDLSLITSSTIVGAVSTETGVRTGLEAVDLVYMNYYQTMNYLIAPKYSHIPAVRNAMITKVNEYNDMFKAMCYTDIPTDEDSEHVIDTRAKAIDWKSTNNYKNEREKVFYPKAIDNVGNIYHLSTLWAVEQLRMDQAHNAIPYETAGNKSIDIVLRPYISATAKLDGYTRGEANQLTQNGITTLIPWEGVFKLWGHHTSAYVFGGTYNTRATFDTNINMLCYLMNRFVKIYANDIDKPMTLQKKQEIEDAENKHLRELVAIGALLEDPEGTSPVFSFVQENNPDGDIVQGYFNWNLGVTPTPPFASGRAIVAYTDAGFKAYFAE